MSAIEPLDGKIYFASLPVDDSTSLTVSNINRTVLFYCSAQNDEIISGKYTMASGTYTDDNYAGEQLVTGSKYILNVDGDDWVTPNYFRELANIVSVYEPDMICFV